MDYKDFTDRQTAYEGFISNRRKVFDSIENGNFNDVFADLCSSAMAGDCIAQDCVAYFFNRGIPKVLAQNYEFYMAWEILAGANGNEFAIEKMEFFLNYALEAIVYDDEILTTALRKHNITKENALMVISNLVCEGIVDQLQLNPKNLIKIQDQPVQYSSQKYRIFREAMEKCLPDVVEFLMS